MAEEYLVAQIPDPDVWSPVEELAVEWGAPVSEVVSRILNRAIEGKHTANLWYFLRPVVTLHYPDPADHRHAELRLRTFGLGNFLTSGRGEPVIPMCHGDDSLARSIALAWKFVRSP